MFGRKKKRQRLLAERLTGDRPSDRLLATLHAGSIVVVDGDAAANLGWPHLPVNSQRQALLDSCETLASDVGATPDRVVLYFDLSVEDVVPRSKGVTVEMVPDRITAAERAHSVVETARVDGRESATVWSDDANGMSLRAAGAERFELGDLLDCFLDLAP